jgi:nucleoside-diphosphate-sugar epimerase
MMRVVVVGATGNAGTSLIDLLRRDPDVESIVGVARRLPSVELDKVKWTRANIAEDDLEPLFAGADGVVHLAWAIQPSRDLHEIERINVEGSRRVFDAASRAGVSKIVYASSVGAYSPSDKRTRRDESWPTEGIPTSFYSRHKAAVEAILDEFEHRNPEIAVVRIRPALMFKRDAASEIRRLFFGPFVPSWLFNRNLLPLIPFHPELTTQVVHSRDVAEAYRLSLLGDVRGAFNLATEPLVTAELIEKTFDARVLRINPGILRGLADATWKLRFQPTPAGWVEMGTNAPLMDASRARRELGWEPQCDARATLLELTEGLREKAGIDTPPMERKAGGILRNREIRKGVGGANP